MTLNDLRDIYDKYHGRPLTGADIKALGGMSGPWAQRTPSQFLQETVFPSTENQVKRRRFTTAPTTDADWQAALKTARGRYSPVLAAGKASYGAQKAGIGVDFDELTKRIREEQTQAESGLSSKFATLGLLQSGATASGLGKIQESTTSNIRRSDIERSIKLADLALQEAGFGADIETKVSSAAEEIVGQRYKQRGEESSLARQEFGAVEALKNSDLSKQLARYGFNITQAKSISDIYAQLLSSGSAIPRDIYDEIKKLLEINLTA
jgi:hypothetical protein